MEKWFMVCSGLILYTCLASSREEANIKFFNMSRYIDWSESDIISEKDLKNESELNALENQTYE